MKIIFTRDST